MKIHIHTETWTRVSPAAFFILWGDDRFRNQREWHLRNIMKTKYRWITRFEMVNWMLCHLHLNSLRRISEVESRKSYGTRKSKFRSFEKSNKLEKPSIMKRKRTRHRRTNRTRGEGWTCGRAVVKAVRDHSAQLYENKWKVRWNGYFSKKAQFLKIGPSKDKKFHSLFSQEKLRKLWRPAKGNRKKAETGEIGKL